ncbi:hypothetical protein RUND412_011274, partial [Rhizina undulata]
ENVEDLDSEVEELEEMRDGNYLIPVNWDPSDIQKAIDYARAKTKSKRPSECEELTVNLRKKPRNMVPVTINLDAKLNKLLDASLKNVSPDRHSHEYSIAWRRVLNNANQWKCQVLKAFKDAIEVTEGSVNKLFESIMEHESWSHVHPRHFILKPHSAKASKIVETENSIAEHPHIKIITEGGLLEEESEDDLENANNENDGLEEEE